ncbi:hypothetical protein [Tahibacter aquaticus]|jgi:hypothetical protein|uniref:hypothetical protein n=1 Tax=Tahibacter aquaticus TaxID=520092 RepID=UPI00141504EF|nr:hypothetical protein [Tahibacter aquaticus]
MDEVSDRGGRASFRCAGVWSFVEEFVMRAAPSSMVDPQHNLEGRILVESREI